jgi:hypothetical protein
MTNPLIAKYEELYGKKEKPKSQKPPIVEYFDEVGTTPPQEVIERLRQLQPNSKIISASNASITITPKPPSLVSYDVDSGKDSFLQIAEKVKNGEAQVTSMSMERDIMSGTSIITFEVRVWDT